MIRDKPPRDNAHSIRINCAQVRCGYCVGEGCDECCRQDKPEKTAEEDALPVGLESKTSKLVRRNRLIIIGLVITAVVTVGIVAITKFSK